MTQLNNSLQMTLADVGYRVFSDRLDTIYVAIAISSDKTTGINLMDKQVFVSGDGKDFYKTYDNLTLDATLQYGTSSFHHPSTKEACFIHYSGESLNKGIMIFNKIIPRWFNGPEVLVLTEKNLPGKLEGKRWLRSYQN